MPERYINNFTGDFSICFSEHLTGHPNYILLLRLKKKTVKVNVVPHLPPSCNIFNVVFLQKQQIVSIFAKTTNFNIQIGKWKKNTA